MDRNYTYTRVNFHKNILSMFIAIFKDAGAFYAILFMLGGVFVRKHTQEAANASLVRRAFDVQLIDDKELSNLIGNESMHKNHEELVAESM